MNSQQPVRYFWNRPLTRRQLCVACAAYGILIVAMFCSMAGRVQQPEPVWSLEDARVRLERANRQFAESRDGGSLENKIHAEWKLQESINAEREPCETDVR